MGDWRWEKITSQNRTIDAKNDSRMKKGENRLEMPTTNGKVHRKHNDLADVRETPCFSHAELECDVLKF